jgi:hypothetical protein
MDVLTSTVPIVKELAGVDLVELLRDAVTRRPDDGGGE